MTEGGAARHEGGGMEKPDWFVLGLVVAMAVLCVTFSATVENYGRDTSSYLLLARSLLAGDGYRLDFEAHTVYPPGFPLILAALMWIGIGSWHALVRATIPLYFAGLYATYLLLKAERGRGTAAVVTLLTGSSTTAFLWTTVGLHSEIPYFTCSAVALLAIGAVGRTRRRGKRSAYLVMGTLGVALLPMIRTIGVSLPLALGLWITVPLLGRLLPSSDPFRTRTTRWAPAVFLAAAVMAGWMLWGSAQRTSGEYDAFMSSYVAQLVKADPHQLGSPNIGIADLPSRIAGIAAIRNRRATQTLLNQPYADFSNKNPLVLLVFAVLTVGFVRSMLTRATLLDFYMSVYAVMLVTWPFDEGNRFLFPVLPFLFAYAVEGARSLWGFVASRVPGRWRPGDRTVRFAAAVGVVFVVGGGIFHSIGLARENRHPDPTSFRVYPTVQAAEWIREHTSPQAVVMAEQNIIVYRLSGRRAYRFPLIVDPARILELIKAAKVDYLVILREREFEYYSPSASRRFRQVMDLAPSDFELVHDFESGSIFAYRGPKPVTVGAETPRRRPDRSGS